MKTFYISFVSIILSMLILDGLWLGIMIKRFYQPQIGYLMGGSPKIIPAVLFYILYAICLAVFVTLPALQNHSSYLDVLSKGMLLGLMAYGTYDLTNHATLKDWPAMVTVVDMVWGAILTGTVSVISTYITRTFT